MTPMPMFPLGSVLVPHAPVGLHIFEERYRALMKDVMSPAGGQRFGVVLIERGSEVGGGDERSMLGTVASIAHATELDDGRWAVVGVGGTRIDVEEWLPDDPYPRANVREREERPWPTGIVAAKDMLAATETLTRRALTMKHSPATLMLSDDPSIRVWQLTALAPITDFDRQRLLGIDDPVERLRQLYEFVEDEVAVLAQLERGL